jgi:hypothetical protein
MPTAVKTYYLADSVRVRAGLPGLRLQRPPRPHHHALWSVTTELVQAVTNPPTVPSLIAEVIVRGLATDPTQWTASPNRLESRWPSR